MTGSPQLTTTAIRQILNVWDQTVELGRHPLAQLVCVEQMALQEGRPDSVWSRGLALKTLLNDAVQSLKPNRDDSDRTTREWRPYLIIQSRYAIGRIPEWIMLELSISERTFYREMRDGLERILARFEHWEELARNRGPEDSSHQGHGRAWSLHPPPYPTDLIHGREALIQAIQTALLDRPGRVVACHGLPGVGKSTIALLIAHLPAIRARFEHKMIWVEAGPQPNRVGLLVQIAQRVGLSDVAIRQLNSASDLARAVTERIHADRWLLILDDVWSVEDAMALTVGGPETRLLITTRHPALAAAIAPGAAVHVAELDEASSVAILKPIADRLNQSEIERLVARTGRLPLTLQIVSRYLYQQGYGGQMGRLRQAVDRLLNLGVGASIDSHGERSSLSAVIGLSIEALSDIERDALLKMGIFPPKPNRFSADAAAQICRIDLESLYRLVDVGLVEPAAGDRYTLHRSIFEVVRADHVFDRLKMAFAHYFCDWVEAVSPDLYLRIEQEALNIEQALRYAASDLDLYVRMLFVYSRYLVDRGRIDAARYWVEQTPQSESPTLDDKLKLKLRAMIDISHGRIAQAENHASEALRFYLEGVSQAEAGGATQIALRAKILAMKMHIRSGQHAAAQALGAETHRRIEEVDDPVWRASAHLALSAVSYYLSDLTAAIYHVEYARQLYEALPNKIPLAGVYQNLGAFSAALGEMANAFIYYDLALERSRQAGHRYREAQIEMNLGVVSVGVGRWRKAHAHYDNALAIQSETGNADVLEQTYLNRAVLLITENELSSAGDSLGRAFELSKETAYLYRRCKLWVTRSMLSMRQHRFDEALEAAYQALEIADEIGTALLTAEAKLQLGILYMIRGEPRAAIDPLQYAAEQFGSQSAAPSLIEAEVYLAWGEAVLGDRSEAKSRLARSTRAVLDRIDGIYDAAEVMMICQALWRKFGRQDMVNQFERRIDIYLKQQTEELRSAESRSRYLDRHTAFRSAVSARLED